MRFAPGIIPGMGRPRPLVTTTLWASTKAPTLPPQANARAFKFNDVQNAGYLASARGGL